MKQLYHSILSSNSADSSQLFNKWKNGNYGYSNGVDIRYNNYKAELWGERENEDSRITIINLPPMGISRCVFLRKAIFMNIYDPTSAKMPQTFEWCIDITFEYCTLSKQYKKDHPHIKYINCKFV